MIIKQSADGPPVSPSTMELLLDSDTDLDITVGGNVTLGGNPVVTGGLPPPDVGAGILIISAGGTLWPTFSSITPDFGIALPSASIAVRLVPEPAEMIPLVLGGRPTHGNVPPGQKEIGSCPGR